ncbi:tetratricopeptide repeat-containing sensor histidine kinase [Sphingobacterium griseoflavum]|nr:tetratricopeptide repeat-containing sensor histidine kinase [Sphingobacterium griseoflavum]
MSIIQRDEGDYFGSQETGLEAIDYLDSKKPEHYVYLSSNYNNLGNVTSALGDKAKAIEFYNLAIKYEGDSASTRTYRNNLGKLYQDEKDYNQAIAIYRAVLKDEKTGTTAFARVLTNYATAMWKSQERYNPVKDFTVALNIRKKEKDLWGQNSSYAHFSDYYAKRNLDSALYFARKQYITAQQIPSAVDQVSALKRLIQLTPGDSSKRYFAVYQQLTDSIQQARAAAKNQFALIRYEVEKNKADNLRLQKDNAEKTNRLIGLSIVFLFAGTGATLWYKKRKQRLELEAQSRVKETQLHLSKKIHDVVANGLYRVMTEFEYKEEIDREGMLDKLDYMYNQSRDISHNVEQQSITTVAYHDEIAGLLKSFAQDKRRILIVGNDDEHWEAVGKRAKQEIKHVLQELMVNMRKHSQADQVLVRFEKVGETMRIYYHDNGVGFLPQKSRGKGLSNTVSRMESLGGSITFVSEPGDGLRITASIPLRKR